MKTKNQTIDAVYLPDMDTEIRLVSRSQNKSHLEV